MMQSVNGLGTDAKIREAPKQCVKIASLAQLPSNRETTAASISA
jgi:hypothetical protein